MTTSRAIIVGVFVALILVLLASGVSYALSGVLGPTPTNADVPTVVTSRMLQTPSIYEVPSESLDPPGSTLSTEVAPIPAAEAEPLDTDPPPAAAPSPSRPSAPSIAEEDDHDDREVITPPIRDDEDDEEDEHDDEEDEHDDEDD